MLGIGRGIWVVEAYRGQICKTQDRFGANDLTMHMDDDQESTENGVVIGMFVGNGLRERGARMR